MSTADVQKEDSSKVKDPLNATKDRVLRTANGQGCRTCILGVPEVHTILCVQGLASFKNVFNDAMAQAGKRSH